jgi:Flp pilus assembly pilin Flp
MAVAHALGMATILTRFIPETAASNMIEYGLLAAAIAFGVVGAMTSEQTVLNARLAAMTSSIAVTSKCRSGMPIEGRNDDSRPPNRRCVGRDKRPSDR